MLKFLEPKKYPIAGIDISNGSLKVMQLKKMNDHYVIQHYAHEPLAPNIMANKEIKNPQALADALYNLFSKSKIETRHVAFALSGNAVVTRVIQLDTSLHGREILSQIEAESDKYLPYPFDQLNLDYQILRPQSSRGPNLMDVQIAAVRSEYLQVFLDVMKLANLVPKIVEIESFSIERAFNLISHFLPNKGKNVKVALIDIGGQITTMHVFLNGEIIYSKEQNFGGGQLTEQIQRRYSLSYEEALSAQINQSLPDDYIHEILEPFKELIAQQIHRAIQLYYSSEQESLIDYIALAGGTVNVMGLDESISQLTSTKTYIVNPCVDMVLEPNLNLSDIALEGPKLLICTGLAMRGIE